MPGLRFAAVWTALVACGNGGTNKLADAPPADTGGSADASPAPPTRVTVHVTLDGAPAPGVVAYFLNADSSVVSSTTTDATGSASAVMAAGGSVTVIEPQEPESLSAIDHLVTVEGVKPGDVFPIAVGNTPVPTASLQVTVPVDPTPGVMFYDAITTCGAFSFISAGSNNPPQNVELTGCNGAADLTVETRDAQNDVLDVLTALDVPIVDGQAVTLTGSYAPAQTVAFAYSGLPGTVIDIEPGEYLFTGRGEMFASSGSAVAPAAGSASATLLAVHPAGVSRLATSSLHNDDSVFDDRTIYQWGSDAPTNTWADAPIKDSTSAATVDLATERVTWTQTATGAAADAVFANLTLSRTTAGVLHTWFWSIEAAGGDAGAVQIPTLPTDVFPYDPIAGDSVDVNNVGTVALPGGYDAIRPSVFGFDPFAVVLATPTGTAQTTVTRFVEPGVLRHRRR